MLPREKFGQIKGEIWIDHTLLDRGMVHVVMAWDRLHSSKDLCMILPASVIRFIGSTRLTMQAECWSRRESKSWDSSAEVSVYAHLVTAAVA